jgi:hypothetical protein
MSRTRELIEDLESYEGVPTEDPRFIEGTPERKAWLLKMEPPRNAREAMARGVDWYIKDHRRVTFNYQPGPPPLYPRKSEKIARTRNLQRQRYGYRDVYSTRDRDWPMPNRQAFYKRQDRERLRRQEQERAAEEKVKGEGI